MNYDFACSSQHTCSNYNQNVSIERYEKSFTHIRAKMKKKTEKNKFSVGDTPQVAVQLIKRGTFGVSSQSLASLSFVQWLKNEATPIS